MNELFINMDKLCIGIQYTAKFPNSQNIMMLQHQGFFLLFIYLLYTLRLASTQYNIRNKIDRKIKIKIKTLLMIQIYFIFILSFCCKYCSGKFILNLKNPLEASDFNHFKDVWSLEIINSIFLRYLQEPNQKDCTVNNNELYVIPNPDNVFLMWSYHLPKN